jgi:hypothetical protein
MPKKPVKIILKFSNNSTPYDNHSSSKGKKKPPRKSGPSEGDKNGGSKPPRKLKP